MEPGISTIKGELYKSEKRSGAGFAGCLKIVLILSLGLLVCSLSAVNLINENIQNWAAHTSYGTWTQAIPAGMVIMTRCLVSPAAVASGTGSIGRVQFEAANGVLELPRLPSVGQVEFHFAAGSAGRTVKLQKQSGVDWVDIVQFTGITATGSTFTYDVNLSDSTSLRLALPSHAIYLYDIIVTDFQNSALPIITTLAVSNITYDTATSGGTVEFAGTSPITAKGVCWSTSSEPTLSNSFTSDGSGISTYNSLMTGLLPDTDYFVRAYGTNSSGTAYGNELSFHTVSIAVPSMQASNLMFYPGNYSIQASWTPGNGARRIVKINTSNSFTLPVNGVDYPANPAYSGQGEQVVYNSATQYIEGEAVNAIPVTGLTPATQYWFRVFDYNGSGSQTFYNTSTALANPFFTTTMNSLPEGYYDGITGSGATLKANLHALLSSTHLTQFTYDGVWQQLQYTDEDSTNTNNVIETYTGWSVPKGFYGSETTNWNREHTWSVSHGGFGTSAPAGTDLHHIRPCDVSTNSAKGNRDFDEGGTAYVDASPYPGYNATTGCSTDADSWEPRDTEKGDVARMLLYMAVRYEGTDTSYNLEMADVTPTTGAFYGKLSTLLDWMMTDPPDSWEMRRNNRIQERQGNRNPFIDHPEYASMIWAPTIMSVTDINPSGFTVNWSPALNATGYFMDVTNDLTFTTFNPGFQNLDVGNGTSFTVNNLTTDEWYYVRIRSYFTDGYGMYCPISEVRLGAVVDMVTLTATETAEHFVDVAWSTSMEHQLVGFNIYRAVFEDFDQAAVINLSILAASNTNLMHFYSYFDQGVAPLTTYYYWVEAIGLAGEFFTYGPVSVFVNNTGVEDPALPLPLVFSLKAHPNPFRTETMIDYCLSKASQTEISIYNLKGQKVKTLLEATKSAGQYQIKWDCTDARGRSVSPGIYFLQYQAGKAVIRSKVVVLH